MSALVITVKVQIRGVNACVPVTSRAATTLKAEWRRPMPVLVTINETAGSPWRTNMMPDGDGNFTLYLHGKMRNSAQVAVGDVVTIGLDFDHAYRNGPMHPLPNWFHVALEKNRIAQINWDSLTPSRQKEVLRSFAALKSEAARERHAVRLIAALSGSVERFKGRDWLDGA